MKSKVRVETTVILEMNIEEAKALRRMFSKMLLGSMDATSGKLSMMVFDGLDGCLQMVGADDANED